MDVYIDHVATHIDGDPVKIRKYVHQFRDKPFLSGNVFNCLRGTYLPEIPMINSEGFDFLCLCYSFRGFGISMVGGTLLGESTASE